VVLPVLSHGGGEDEGGSGDEGEAGEDELDFVFHARSGE
jgi:hypothetical protein